MTHQIKTYFVILVLTLCYNHTIAQSMFIGKWEMNYEAADRTNIKITLDIGNPEREMLFPAKLSFSTNEFSAEYQLLLVKKTSRSLAISKNKFPLAEKPFSLGNWTILLNGVFEFSKDVKGIHQLYLNRIAAKKIGIDLPNPNQYPPDQRNTASQLYSIMKDGEIVLKKTSPSNSLDLSFFKITQPKLSLAYFGIIDTIIAQKKEGIIQFQTNNDNDIITLSLNGNLISDQIDSKKRRDAEDIQLDTGINIVALFADDFGKKPPSSASVLVDFGENKRFLDFNKKENFGASLIVLKVVYRYDPSTEKTFRQLSVNDFSDTLNNKGYQNALKTDTRLKQKTKTLDRLVNNSKQITFALWDDEVEDGDSISININGKWIINGFPVKNKPQFINVTLEPGPNNITFAADNLGSIIPNTSVLEIIDGNKRKSYRIESDMNENNQVKIFYNMQY